MQDTPQQGSSEQNQPIPDSVQQGILQQRLAQKSTPQQGTQQPGDHREDNPPNKPVDSMTPTQRWGGLYTVVLMVLLLVFFAAHEWKKTGFFNSKFGPLEMVALYLPIIVSLAAPILRLVQGKRNPSRPLEAASEILLAIGSIILWNNFPFDFAHIADIFPPAMRIAFAWLTNNVGRFILILQIVIGFISALSIITTYIQQRRRA